MTVTRGKKKKIAVCKRKQVYKTSKIAKRTARFMGMREYKCPICKLFHLTSMKF